MSTTTGILPLDVLRQAAHPLTDGAGDYDPLLELIGDARFVLLGEASHGTHDFYHERALLTRRLITEKGFTAVAVEADWPDAYRVDRYVRGEGTDGFAIDALADFKRFPTWMWRNTVIAGFIESLRLVNEARPPGARVGFYGLDLYSLRSSMEEVLRFLERVDPPAVRKARERYACFDHSHGDLQYYGLAAAIGIGASCEHQVIEQLLDLQRRTGGYHRLSQDEAFAAEQNARLVKNAEAYYRSMFLGEEPSWNVRDRHMAEALTALADHLSGSRQRARIVVWAHNSHLGDARATEMSRRGELNLGQLVRQRYGDEVRSVGFTTYTGTVTAASDWGEPAERKRIRPALPGSHEELFHRVGIGRFLLRCHENGALEEVLREPRLERAIGVIYRPASERSSHYFEARLAEQFDAVIHFDDTVAVEPLERGSGWERGEVPDTFPSGM
jgi:erythromycin esterase-like protein